MEIEAVGRPPSPIPHQPTGVTAELAEARVLLRHATPAGRWDAVLAEVARLQVEASMSGLDALQAVHAKLASGWVPPPSR
jgi:hypothetical protein